MLRAARSLRPRLAARRFSDRLRLMHTNSHNAAPTTLKNSPSMPPHAIEDASGAMHHVRRMKPDRRENLACTYRPPRPARPHRTV